METGFKVLDAMTKMPITISSSLSITNAAREMVKSGVGSLLIVDGDEVRGIITEGDLTYRVIAKSLSPDKTTVSDIMTTDVISLAPDLDIYDALVQMNSFEIRHAPVIHKGKLVGFLTQKDILKIQPDLFDLIVERLHIREESDKPIHGDIRLIE